MKVLFLTRLYWPHIGGVERHVEEVSKRLVERGHKVVVVTEEPSTPLRCEKLRIWWWFWKNRKLIENSDIVHAHDIGFWYFPFRFLYPKKPFFITFHGWEGEYPVPLKNKIIRKISEKLAKGNICVGDYIAKWYGTKTDYITYGGVNPPPRRSPSATSEVSLPNLKLITFIGRLEKDTGLPIYLKALKKFIIHNSKFIINFLGEGRLGERAEKFGKVLGFVRDIRPYIFQSRFVFTSGYLAILEAMSGKRLVFAVYDNPLKKDYLEVAPFAHWLVIENNPKKLREKIEYYLGHPKEEKKLVNQAYNWVKEETWEKVVQLYLKLWQEACGIQKNNS